jgi:Domain of unknown function DUF29
MEHVAAQPKARGMSEYDTDLILWSREQADLLRRIGAGERASAIRLQVSPPDRPRTGWKRTVAEQRVRIERLLEDSPSLRQFVPEAIPKELPSARSMALLDLAEFEDQPAAETETLVFSDAQVLGPWMPD